MARFFEGYHWRWIFTTIPSPNSATPSVGGVTTTWAEGLLSERTIVVSLNQPTVISAAVYSNYPEVNRLFDDFDPLIAQSNRLVYCLRRESPGPVGTEPQDPWVCRASGILMSPEDQGDPDVPVTHFTAYDAWQYMMGRPVYKADGNFPKGEGTPNFTAAFGNALTGDQIALNVLKNSITYDKSGPLGDGFCFIDAGTAWGGTEFYSGTLESTPPLTYTLQQSQMVGEVWADLCDSGTMDIVLTPIYDPINRPGYTHELNIYALAGTEKPNAVFAWGKLMRSLNTADRMHDGTPQSFINIVNYFVGQGGPPSNLLGPTENVLAVAKYLPYWSSISFPGQTATQGNAVQQMALQALRLGKQGRRTMTVGATPERSPIPFIDYDIGDRVPLHTSRALRVASSGYQRVEVIPISISDDGIEEISALLCSPDYRDAGGGGGGDVPPLPPDAYPVPGGAVSVSTASELIDELAAETPAIVLEDGTYDNPTPFLNPGSSSVYAENLGGATLTAGIVVGGNDGPGGAVIQGLDFDVSDPDKSTADSANACINAWGATADDLSVLDCTFAGHYVVAQGLYAINPDGLTARRLVLNHFTDEAIRASNNTTVDYHDPTAIIAAITDINIDGVTYATPGGSGGTAEAGLWIGHPVTETVARIKIRNVAWSGIETVNNSWDTTFDDLDIDMTGPNEYASVAVYCEHFSLHNTIQNFVFVAATGVNCEWDNDIPGNAGAHFLIVQDGSISSNGTARVGNQAGVYADQGTESTTVRRVTFIGQNWAAIGAYLNTGTNHFTDNDYSGIDPGAVSVSPNHI